MPGSIAEPMVLRITKYLKRILGLGPYHIDRDTYWKRFGILTG